MQLSAKKSRDLTQLEVQAQQIVNDDESEPEVTDEQKYEALLQKKQERRPGESLYEFLERQVKGQMRDALGQPLQNISNDLLNRVVSKEVQANMKKYKMNIGKTPQKEKKTVGFSTADKANYNSPQRKGQQITGGTPGKGIQDRHLDNSFKEGNSKEVKELLKEIERGVHDKIALMKMIILKFGDVGNNYKKLRGFVLKGDSNNAEKLLTSLEQQNQITMKDLQGEVAEQPDLIDLLQQLNISMMEDKRDALRQKSQGKEKGGESVSDLKKLIEDLEKKNKDLEQSKQARKESLNKDLMSQLNEADMNILELRKQLDSLEIENGDLRNEVRRMNDEFLRQLDNKEAEIKGLVQKSDTDKKMHQNEAMQLLKRENESQRQENRMMREKINQLNHEVEFEKGKSQDQSKTHMLENEINHLREKMSEKEREHSKQMDYYKNMIYDKDNSSAKQKNEWAEIYGNMKQEIEDLKKDNRNLGLEFEKSQMGAANKNNEKELAKKLKKRELECSALWETLKDMHIANRNIFDARQMMDLLALRALDTKAKRKLKL